MMIGLEVAPVAPAAVHFDQVGVDGVEPELGAGGDEGLKRGHGVSPELSGWGREPLCANERGKVRHTWNAAVERVPQAMIARIILVTKLVELDALFAYITCLVTLEDDRFPRCEPPLPNPTEQDRVQLPPLIGTVNSSVTR